MARYTKAYSSFVNSVGEVETLCSLARRSELRDPMGRRAEIGALVRGGIVLLSSHVEAYIRELGEAAITSLHAKGVPRKELPSGFFYHVSRELLTSMRDSTDPERIADWMFEFLGSDHVEYWSRCGPFPLPIATEGFSRGFSNPKFDRVCNYFNRFGYSEFRKELGRSLKGSFRITTNSIDHLVDTRNAIAHGNRDERKTALETRDLIASAREFCRSTDVLFASWWRDQYCSIR